MNQLARAKQLGKAATLEEKAKAINDKLSDIEKKLVNPDIKASQDVLNFPPALDHQFAGLAGVVSSADAKPTDASFVFYKEVKAKLDAATREYSVVSEQYDNLNQDTSTLTLTESNAFIASLSASPYCWVPAAAFWSPSSAARLSAPSSLSTSGESVWYASRHAFNSTDERPALSRA